MERLLETTQEFGYICLFVFMGVFVYPQDSQGLCTATAIIIMFFMDFVALIFLVKEVLATCMIRNLIKHINTFHWTLAFAFPVLGAAVATIVGYFTCSNYFGIQQPHCFCYTRTKQFWAFVMPVWISFVLMTLVQQFAFTMCKMTDLEGSNLAQMYWSFKTCKSSTLLFTWSAVAIYSLMFAVDLQVMWLSFGYFLASLIFGPMLFVCHTYSHANTCISLYAQTSVPFYRPCPPPPAAYNEQINFMLSIRMQIPLFEDPSIKTGAGNASPNRMVVIETPPSIKKRKSRKRTYLGERNVRPVPPPPVVDWQ
uniref:G_PROTEIN_RECEP_F2_4 domain-containing protein n=3 Tax=Bursaphelenchus xylophilus TaxID=6326 RepID=A0A1I7SRT5_BURXY